MKHRDEAVYLMYGAWVVAFGTFAECEAKRREMVCSGAASAEFFRFVIPP